MEVVRLLISEGADKEKATSNGYTPLVIACQEGHLEMGRLLISEGADLNAQDHRRFTALHIAAANNNNEVCMIL